VAFNKFGGDSVTNRRRRPYAWVSGRQPGLPSGTKKGAAKEENLFYFSAFA